MNISLSSNRERFKRKTLPPVIVFLVLRQNDHGSSLCLVFCVFFRDIHRRCSVKMVLLEISQNSQENTCARISFLIKQQDLALGLTKFDVILSCNLWPIFSVYHSVKYRNFTYLPSLENLWKCSFVKIGRSFSETVHYENIFTPGNQVKLRYFMQYKE